MEIIIAVVSFLVGYFAQKLFDAIYEKVNLRIRHKKVQKKVRNLKEKIILEETPILTLAIGKPKFTIADIYIQMDERTEMFLAFPHDLLPSLPASSGSFSQEDVCDFPISIKGVSQEIFKEALEHARTKIAKGFLERKNGLYFNGARYGVSYVDSFSRTCDEVEKPILTIKLFNTDHFTHKVIEETIDSLKPLDQIFSLNSLNNELKFLRTSIGVSIIVRLKSSNEIILTRRSQNAAYSNGGSWIYVSATEAMSQTDYDSFISKPRLDFCVKRGLFEELGITETMYSSDDIYYTDYFFETNFMQDGIVAVVELDESITSIDVENKARQAKDFELEIENFILIKNDVKAIDKFIVTHSKEMRDQTKFALMSYCARL